MALNISISKGDLAKGIPVAEGWKEFEITDVNAAPAKKGDSINYIISFKLLLDPNEREIDHLFNSKALGMMAPLLAALSGKTVQEVLDSITTGEINIDLESFKTKHVMGNVKQEIFEGRVLSKIQEFATVGKVPF